VNDADSPAPASRVKTLWLREPYLSQILSGRKTVEVRVGYDNIRRLQAGDQLKLNGEHLVTIRRIGRYADFEELLAYEDPAAIAPDLPAGELLAAIRDIYPPDKEALGAIALDLALPGREPADESRRYEAVLFDMGYTLVYFDPPQEIVVQQALRKVGAERSTDQILAAVRDVWGAYEHDAATALFPATPEYDRQSQQALEGGLLAYLGLDSDEERLRTYSQVVDAEFGRPGVIRPYPEAVHVLEALQKKGYRLGIVSNWSWNLRERVALAGLDRYFEVVWASAYAGCNKPHPCIFQQVLDRLQVPAGRAFYVGDSYRHDVIGARNAGVDVALLDRDGTAGATDCPVIRNLWEVFGFLARKDDLAGD
jgi:FMN phosphatase YigB (HAD superfamily)/ASC-1-like (ASCH) protein